MVNSLDRVCENIKNEFWATLGLEQGVQEQTEAAMAIMREVACDLPCMESVAVIPVGSRVKGYATLESDMDIAMIVYEDGATPYKARKMIGKVITERLGIVVCKSHFTDQADEILTIDMIDYGHAACFGSEDIPFTLSPAIFEGERVAELKMNIFERRRYEDATFFEFADKAFRRKLIMPKMNASGVAARYINLLSQQEESGLGISITESMFGMAYGVREQQFSGNMQAKIEHQLIR